jgi:hypothetical protein
MQVQAIAPVADLRDHRGAQILDVKFGGFGWIPRFQMYVVELESHLSSPLVGVQRWRADTSRPVGSH